MNTRVLSLVGVILGALLIYQPAVAQHNQYEGCIPLDIPDVNNTGRDAIRINGADSIVQNAVNKWAACYSVGSGDAPELTTSGTSGKVWEVRYKSGTFEGSACTGVITEEGGVNYIDFYWTSSTCTTTKKLAIAIHELGHVLDLDHSNCGTAMDEGSTKTSLLPAGEECEAAGGANTTKGEMADPLILDLGGRDGVITTGEDSFVFFDMDSDGEPEPVTWTAPGGGQGFLAVDLNGNGQIDNGSELFGDSTYSLDGVPAEHGFEALNYYDFPEYGGNGDGILDARDRVWQKLRLWVDVNHDGISRKSEVRRLDRYGVVAMELDFDEVWEYDAEGNLHLYRGTFHLERRGGQEVVRAIMDDVFFRRVQ